MKAIFLDRDGTVSVGTPTYERIDSLDKAQLLPQTLEAMKIFARLDYGVFLVTNQMSLAEKRITVEQFWEINQRIADLLSPSGVAIVKTYYCPHTDEENCECRKPKPKLLLDAAKEYGIDLRESWMIGDRPSDVQTGINAGTKTVLVKTGVPTVESGEATFTAPTLLEAAQYIEAEGR